MKVGDLVKPRSNWHSRWYGHPDSKKIVGLILAELRFDEWEHSRYDVMWSGNIFEPGAAGSGLEVVSEAESQNNP